MYTYISGYDVPYNGGFYVVDCICLSSYRPDRTINGLGWLVFTIYMQRILCIITVHNLGV